MQIGSFSKIDFLDRGVIGSYTRWLKLTATQTFSFTTAVLAGLFLACGASWAAPTQTVLHSFGTPNGPSGPTGRLIQASDGNFYGVMQSFGANNKGYIYKLTPGGVFSTLFSFSGSDGWSPRGLLIQGSDGNLYGVTAQGGSASGTCDCGTVFKLTLAGAITTLHSFTGVDGMFPVAGLIQGSDGDFYGTTGDGGGLSQNNVGTVFTITSAGVLITIHRFVRGLTDGIVPSAALVQKADGTLYGTTHLGGANAAGTIFKLATDGSGFELVHSFEFADSLESVGAELLLASDDNLYGVTREAPTPPGSNPVVGAVYQLTPANIFTRIYTFPSSSTSPIAPHGSVPRAGLIQASDGNLYGTTTFGGSAGVGTVFRLDVGLSSSSPTAAISLDKTSITLGSGATLTWSSSNVTSCAASNAWTGSQSTSGTQSVTPVAVGTFTYTLTCSGSGGSANGSATLTVTPVGGGGGGGSSGGGGGGCAMNPNRGFDAILPLLFLIAMGWIARRRVS